MKQPITFQGRSFLFNVLFVLLNLTGLTLIVLGFHDNFEEDKDIFESDLDEFYESEDDKK